MPLEMRLSSAYNNPDSDTDLTTELNHIVTYLWEGEAWHEKAANECRKVALRGWGRWHDAEGLCDAKSRFCLTKLLRDKLSFVPEVDISVIETAMGYTMSSSNDIKAHHVAWIEREERLIACINNAIPLMASVDVEIYKKLICLADEVQNEAMRARLAYSRLEMAGWSGHDMGVCSMIIHKYFECEYDGGDIDFNIG